jgi:aryl-alcohol dehydrogenase-like predicted oxidoreductase
LQKVEKVKFLAGEDVGRTLSQAAIQFCLYQPTIVSVLPNFTTLDELRDYTAAVDTPPLTNQEQAQLEDLWENAFDLAEAAPQFREI